MYAEAQNNLGIAYRNLSKLEDRGQPGAVDLGLRGGAPGSVRRGEEEGGGGERKGEKVEEEKGRVEEEIIEVGRWESRVKGEYTKNYQNFLVQ